MTKFTTEEIKSLTNSYLLFGYKEDIIDIVEMSIVNNTIEALINVKSIFYENKIKYHLSATQIYIWTQQLCSVYARWDNKPSKGFLYLLSNDLTFKKLITTRAVHISATLKKRKTKNGTLYFAECDVEQGKAHVTVRFLYSSHDIVATNTIND